ncbi:MAG: DUF1365 domain-containing protein [Planktomarina sp.]
MTEHITGHTYHGRKGKIENAFRYSIDYVLIDLDAPGPLPKLFALDRFNVASLRAKDHGGPPKNGEGVAWAKRVFDKAGFAPAKVMLLAQPRFWGHVFNPVSFWLAYDEHGNLKAVIAEVTNTFGDRHSYLCHHDDFTTITRDDSLTARKIFHVSPFQPIAGGYVFRFDITDDKIGIWIDFSHEGGGLIATLTGPRKALTNGSIIKAAIRRPLGSWRVLALIHWQALKLWRKGAAYRNRPTPPTQEVSKS